MELTMLRLFKEESQNPSPSSPSPTPSTGSINFDRNGNKIYFISLGCPRNLVDSEVMLGILLKAGYEAAQELQEADYLVINTCGFLEASRGESSETIAS